MATRIHIGCLILLFCVVNCSDTERLVSDESTIQADQFRSYRIEMDMLKIKLADLIDTIEMMRLEETGSSIIGRVSRLEEFVDGYILTSKGKGVLFFNKAGDFISRFDHDGLGPGEYVDIYDYWLEGDTIAIFSRGAQRIIRYDFDGNYISSIKLPYYSQHVYPLEEGYVYDLNFGTVRDSLKHRVYIGNVEHTFQKAFLPFDIPPKMKYFSQFPSLKEYGTDATYLGPMSDTVYHVSHKEIKPLVHFDFGEKWYWTEKGKMNPKQYMMHKGEKVDNIDAEFGESYIWLSARLIATNTQPFLINRTNDSIISIDLRNSSDGRHSIFPLKWSGDKLLGSIQSNDLVVLYHELGKSRFKLRQGTTLEEIESSENPVLVWVKFK